MKLINEETGEINETDAFYSSDDYPNHYCLKTGWREYEEPKGSALDLMILTLTNFIENEPDEDKVDLEDCKQMLEKLKAWKRLKNKGFEIENWTNDIGDNYYKTGQIILNLNNIKNREWDEYDQISEIKNDLDLLFGGEE